MRVKRKVVIAIATGLVLGGLAATAAAGGFASLYNTPNATTMIFGSSGNIPQAATGKPGSMGGVIPGQCELVGVGDYIGSTPCPSLLQAPYELTETPITAKSGTITYFSVTTTNPAPAGGGNYINFSIRLCEDGAGAPWCNNSPPGGITKARCFPVAGSHTCSWIGKLPFQQWQPPAGSTCAGGVGTCHSQDPTKPKDEGLIDIVMSRGCGSTCPNGTYDPGHVSWSVAYIK
jgi:hypothetical protein